MPDIIWVEAQRRLRGELLDKDYDTWIAPLRAARWSADTLALEAPSGFARDWLRQHFLPALERAVSEASGSRATVLLLVNRELSVPARAGALPARQAACATNGAPSRYTFDNFVVGESNRVAYGAARAVVAQPGARFNPLFLCGGCGLGKTHLLSAVATGLAHARPLGTVVCLTAENFVNEMIAARAARRARRAQGEHPRGEPRAGGGELPRRGVVRQRTRARGRAHARRGVRDALRPDDRPGARARGARALARGAPRAESPAHRRRGVPALPPEPRRALGPAAHGAPRRAAPARHVPLPPAHRRAARPDRRRARRPRPLDRGARAHRDRAPAREGRVAARGHVHAARAPPRLILRPTRDSVSGRGRRARV